jgi:DNA-binding transcriptional LysR family regulator
VDRWTECELFVQAAELGSLTKAAEALGLSNASASRHLASLEHRLGARLIERNTRRLFVTEAGELFLHRCKAVLADMQEAEHAVNATVVDPSGLLRVTSSLSFSLEHITPLLPAFTQRYPKLRVEVVAVNRFYDIIDNNIDVAIRTREYESDSSLVIRQLAQTWRIPAASPAYLAKHGVPTYPRDLERHRLLLYNLAYRPDELPFRRGDESVVVQAKGLLDTNDGQIVLAAARQGLGVLVQPMFVIYNDLVAGRLVPLLPGWQLPPLAISLVYQHRRHVPAKVRAFIDFIVDDFRDRDHEARWAAIASGRAVTPPSPAPLPATATASAASSPSSSSATHR